MSLNLNLLSCPKCGGKLNDLGEGRYSCAFCNREWEREVDNSFDKILGGFNEAIQAEKAASIARLKRALYDETHKEFISAAEVERICRDIIEHYDDEDFYARFYLATCVNNRTALDTFYNSIDLSAHKDDVADMLDYLITGLREEWILTVGHMIECAYKASDIALYSAYRTRFEEMAAKVQSALFEPTLHRDVFVMYSGKDMDKVLKMVSILENEYKLSCFVAARNLRHGAGSVDRYKDAIHEAIENSDVYLLISSDNSRDRGCEVYEEILYISKNFPDRYRVEFLAEDYKGYGIEKKFKEFFSGLEYCTSYEDTAERISDYCDELKFADKREKAPTVTVQIPEAPISVREVSSEQPNQFLSKAVRLMTMEDYKEAFKAYEKAADLAPENISAFIGMVAALSENYTKINCPEAEKHITVINKFFGEKAAFAADGKYSDYIGKIKSAKEAERRRKEEEVRKKREAEEAERRRKEEEARKKIETEEAERRRLEEIRKMVEIEEAERNTFLRQHGCSRDGQCIYFGSWPQSKVTDSSLIAELNIKGGTLPKAQGIFSIFKKQEHSWTSYKYYINESNKTDFMWYIDVEHNGERYRGVYFTSYRPYWTNYYESTVDKTYQSKNGYSKGTVYWFKWEAVKWRILTESGGKALLLSELLIDSQEYHVSNNNYSASNIRKWINETFYKTAFSEMQKSLIQLTNVDNSVSSTGYSSNKYACENTSDRVFLLSIKELGNSGYGLGSDSSRIKNPTEYAKCQGAYTDTGGAGLWWSRSPHGDYSYNARAVRNDGSFINHGVNDTCYGVCPALWISLQE